MIAEHPQAPNLAPARDGDTTSVWAAEVASSEWPRLRADTAADVCVVGAGIAGLTTAYLLAREGRSVIVIDDKAPGDGQTSRTSAHLSAVLDDGLPRLERLHGLDGLRLAVASHAAAIDLIDSICASESIECGFRRVDEYIFAPLDKRDELDHELEAARRAGLDVEMIPRAPLDRDTGPCLRFRRQAQFQPLAYLAGLVRLITRSGGHIHSRTHADTITGGETATVQTGHGPIITARAVVVATNVPVNDLAVIHTKQSAYRSYLIGARVAKGAVTEALYSDTLDPYHYVRVHPGSGHDTLVIGGEDHKTGQDPHPETRWDRLATWAREWFPMMGVVDYRWSGQIVEPVDGLAFIGRNPADRDNVYVATGDSGHGLTHGTIAGLLLTDLIQGRDNPWAKLYDPSRRTVRAIKEFASENLNVAAQYADWLKRGDVASADDITRGQGAVVRHGLKLIATYVDESGGRHECSAACPHLGGVVQWNPAERTWDCPCHGSRFDPYGRVVEGPAISDLAQVDKDAG